MNIRLVILFYAVLITSFIFSQQPSGTHSHAVKTSGRALQIDDFAGWQRIEQRLISNDGKLVVFETKQQKGDGFVVIYNSGTNTSDTIHNAYDAKISALSDYAVVKLRLPEDSLRRLKIAKTKKEDMPKDAIGIFTFADRRFQRIDSVKSFALPDENSNWLSYLTEGPKQNKKPTFSLNLLEPVRGTSFQLEKADTFAIALKDSRIALLTAADSLKIRSLVIIDPERYRTDTLLRDSLEIRSLTFDSQAKQLAWLATKDTVKTKNYGLYYSQTDKRNYRLIADSLSKTLPSGWAPSVNGPVYFSEDGSKLFFGTAPKAKAKDDENVPDDEKARLDIWSHTDNVLMPRQLKQLSRDRKKTYLALYRIGEQQLIQLADTTVETIRLQHHNNGEIALGTDRKPYERSITWSSRMLTDYYLVDLKTGYKRSLLKGGQHLQLSPKGKFALWYDSDQKQYYTMNLASGISQPVTAGIGVPLTDELHDTPDDPSPYGIAGWTDNDERFILYDRYDLWLTDAQNNHQPVNLTNGRSTKTRYRYIDTDTEKASLSSTQDLLLSMVSEDNFKEGYAALQLPGLTQKDKKEARLTTLINGNFSIGSIVKAKNSSALLWSRQTVKQFPEIELSTLDFSKSTIISSTNNHQQAFIWPTVELVEWTSFAGDNLRGLLYKPDNFDPGKSYPMVVYFYERSSDTYHRYNYPQPSRSIISIPFYVSNGYLVFVPDIVYTTGYPGKNAYDAIVSGVNTLLSTRSYINARALGLQGQSWGGYQIAHLITQTDMFAAAMAGAPVSNMTSAYGGIRWGTGMSRMFQYENTQSRIGGTLWDRPLLYLENSPVFHAPRVTTPLLMMHNDNDGAVPWYQGIEYFMALYRLGKPVWMLNYNGMEHNIEWQYWANRIDLSTRMFGFFNHYLKGEKAPEWMIKGRPAIEK